MTRSRPPAESAAKAFPEEDTTTTRTPALVVARPVTRSLRAGLSSRRWKVPA